MKKIRINSINHGDFLNFILHFQIFSGLNLLRTRCELVWNSLWSRGTENRGPKNREPEIEGHKIGGRKIKGPKIGGRKSVAEKWGAENRGPKNLGAKNWEPKIGAETEMKSLFIFASFYKIHPKKVEGKAVWLSGQNLDGDFFDKSKIAIKILVKNLNYQIVQLTASN